ncbi:MAG: hypothetical protein Q8P57_04330 [Candidatus Pacearchaeota archaeon]|nr:hypothetical protein [Candidatus Pacearchaeota archaeon]
MRNIVSKKQVEFVGPVVLRSEGRRLDMSSSIFTDLIYYLELCLNNVYRERRNQEDFFSGFGFSFELTTLDGKGLMGESCCARDLNGFRENYRGLIERARTDYDRSYDGLALFNFEVVGYRDKITRDT